MSRNRRPQHRARLLIAAAFAVLSVGCGSSDASFGAGAGGSAGTTGDAGFEGAGGADAGGGAGGRGGLPPYFDPSPEALADNPIEQLFADPLRNPWDLLGVDAAGAQGYVDAALTCYADGPSCDAPECAAFASCCVASGSCCAPAANSPLPDALDFGSCNGLTFDGCAAGQGFNASVFGEQEPVLTSRGVVPNGSATEEGGALVGDAVDLASQRVLVEVQFSLPIDCKGTCLQSAGVAFTRGPQSEAFGGAEVGLLLSGSRELVNLMIGGQVADSFDAGDDDTAWLLVLSPSGMLEVERDGVAQGSYPFAPESLRHARLAIFGRNLGTPANSAAIARITTRIEDCDSPRGWGPRIPIAVAVQGDVDPQLMMGREPSVAAGPEFTSIGFESDGEIFVGQADGLGVVIFDAPGPPASIFPTEAFEAGGVADPELFWLEDSLYVFYTAYDENGVGRIGSAVVSGSTPTKGQDPVLSPEGDVVSYESPTIMLRDDLAVMVVRATLSSGATELRAFYSVDPETGWARIVGGTLEQLTHVDDPTAEISSPSLIVHNSAYQLYYARRTGTRWAIELATSDELLIWRPLGVALGASGQDFDSLGTRGPDALSDGDMVYMVYMGQDGVSSRLGITSRSAPSNTARQ